MKTKIKAGKLAALFAATIVALAGTGIAYAHWSETMAISGNVETGELDWEITSVTLNDPLDQNDFNCGDGFVDPWPFRTEKDVGYMTYTQIDERTLQVTLHNTYPGYYGETSFYVHNSGTIPFIIKRGYFNGIEFTDIGHIEVFGDDYEVRYGNNFGAQIHPCSSAELSFDTHVFQSAEMGATYTFTLEIEAVQWNEA